MRVVYTGGEGEITDVAVVVTRYFGGVLLGTGGLVRAYQAATQAGIVDTAYEAEVTMTILVPEEQKEILPKEITELTNGTAGLEWGNSCVYALIDKEVVFF